MSSPSSLSRLPALIVVAALLFGAFARAQTAPRPPNAPSWWNVKDENTVSVSYTFDSDTWPPTPNTTVAPSWFQGVTWTKSNNVQWMASVTDHQGVWGISQIGVDTMEAGIDNDPRVDWIKIFDIEYDGYFIGNDTLVASQSSPASIRDHNPQMTVEDIGNGWKHVTVHLEMIPQPDDEQASWSFDVKQIGNPVAMDNVFFSTRCIPEDSLEDTSTGPLGGLTGFGIDVGAMTGNQSAVGVAYTAEQTGNRSYFVSASAAMPGQPHLLHQFDGSGFLLGTLDQPTSHGAPSQVGLRDLTVAGTSVCGLIENGMGGWEMQCFDTVMGRWDPSLTVQLRFLPLGATVSALAYSPDGDEGKGSFWTVDQQGTAYEYDSVGNLVRRTQSGAQEVSGAACDPVHGMLYWFGRAGSSDPRGIQVVVTEFDIATHSPSGVQFYGDLGVSGGAMGSPGGRALGMTAYRDPEFKIVCLADGASDMLYELRGPFQYGFSCVGSIGMGGGPPYVGNSDWQITLKGIHDATAAGVYLGFSDKTYLGQTLPFPLQSFSLPTCTVLASLEFFGGPTPITNDRAVMSIPIPNDPSLRDLETFWQWVVLSPRASSAGIGLSNAGSTVIR